MITYTIVIEEIAGKQTRVEIKSSPKPTEVMKPEPTTCHKCGQPAQWRDASNGDRRDL